MFNKEKLQTELNKRGISQLELDRRLGVKSGMVSKYTRGVREPSPEQLYRFLLAIGWTEESLKSELLINWYTPENGQKAI